MACLILVLKTHFQGTLDGSRTVIGKVEPGQTCRDHLHKLFTQFYRRFVGKV